MRRRSLLLLFGAWPGLAAARPRPPPAELEINQATQAQLESLPGIGPALAERILAARAGAPFHDWDDLQRRVRGLKAALAARLSAAGLRVQGQSLPDR